MEEAFTLTVTDLSRLLQCTETTVWRWLDAPYRLPFQRKRTSDRPCGRVHHMRLSDLLPRLRSVRRGGLSDQELALLIELDSQRRRGAANKGDLNHDN